MELEASSCYLDLPIYDAAQKTRVERGFPRRSAFLLASNGPIEALVAGDVAYPLTNQRKA